MHDCQYVVVHIKKTSSVFVNVAHAFILRYIHQVLWVRFSWSVSSKSGRRRRWKSTLINVSRCMCRLRRRLHLAVHVHVPVNWKYLTAGNVTASRCASTCTRQLTTPNGWWRHCIPMYVYMYPSVDNTQWLMTSLHSDVRVHVPVNWQHPTAHDVNASRCTSTCTHQWRKPNGGVWQLPSWLRLWKLFSSVIRYCPTRVNSIARARVVCADRSYVKTAQILN